MVPEKQLNDFVQQLRQAAGANLESVILYGSAVTGDFQPEFSNLNLLCILRDTSFQSLQALAPAVEPWNRKKHAAPLFMTRLELERSTDVFTIELLDMRQCHRVLFGDDVVAHLEIPTRFHRMQLEYELREKLILLRQNIPLAAGDRKRMWDILLRSVASFATLFRHTFIAMGEPVPASKRDAVRELAGRLAFDPTAIHQVLDVREGKISTRDLNLNDIFARYVTAIEQVTAAVDRMLDSSAARGS
jgi:hypothetical protein